jgi:hypothetical protein
MDKKVVEFLDNEPNGFDAFIEAHELESTQSFFNPISGRSIKKYGPVWKSIVSVLDSKKGTSLGVEKKEIRKVGKIVVADKSWDLFGDIQALTSLFQNAMDLQTINMRPSEAKFKSDWTEDQIESFRLNGGIFHPITGQRISEKKRGQYVSHYKISLRPQGETSSSKRKSEQENDTVPSFKRSNSKA